MWIFKSQYLDWWKHTMLLETSICPILCNSTILYKNNSISVWNIVQRVSNQQNSLLFQVFVYCYRKQEGSNMSINCTQNIVQNVDVSLTVERSRQWHPRFLSTWKSRTLLSDNSQICVFEEREIGLEGGVFEDLGVEFGIVGFSEENVVADSIVHNPRNLTRISHCPVDSHYRISDIDHLSNDTIH